jgi:RNA-binding protein
MKLTGKQNRYLRGLGHHLDPVVMTGKAGLTESIVTSTSQSLDTHELIKLRVQDGCDLDRKEVANQLAKVVHAQLVQVLGRTFLLYRKAEETKITLP